MVFVGTRDAAHSKVQLHSGRAAVKSKGWGCAKTVRCVFEGKEEKLIELEQVVAVRSAEARRTKKKREPLATTPIFPAPTP
jgi:hypothetical protein